MVDWKREQSDWPEEALFSVDSSFGAPVETLDLGETCLDWRKGIQNLRGRDDKLEDGLLSDVCSLSTLAFQSSKLLVQRGAHSI